MDELTLDNKKYLSSKRAAQVTGYAKDYVGQLCREGRVNARLVGRNWYVLESSILEHRFGAEEQDAAPEAAPAPMPTWEAPRYMPEPIETGPALTPKPAAAVSPEETAKMLTDMQSAWQEWLERDEQALPDASQMLLEDHEEPSIAVPEPSEAPLVPVAAPELVPEEAEEEVAIHIARRPEPIEAPRAMRDEAIFDLRAARSADQPLQIKDFGAIPERRSRPVRRQNGGGFVLRAVFVAVALIALGIAAVGSGFLDKALESSKAGSFVTDFFAGKQQVSK